MKKNSKIFLTYSVIILYLLILITADLHHNAIYDFKGFFNAKHKSIEESNIKGDVGICNKELCLACLLNSALQSFHLDSFDYFSLCYSCNLDFFEPQDIISCSNIFSFDPRSPPFNIL